MNIFEKFWHLIVTRVLFPLGKRAVILFLITVLWAPCTIANDANFEASATIIDPLQLENVRNLAFGSIVPDVNGAGAVIIRPNGSRFCASNISCFDEAYAAQFRVTSPPGAALRFQLPSAFDISNGQASMTVDRMRVSIKPGTPRLSRQRTFFLGARLNVGAAQAPGVYKGTFQISVDYE